MSPTALSSDRTDRTIESYAALRTWSLRAVREAVLTDPGSSLMWSEHGYPDEVPRWNYHPEFELHHIRSTSGRFIVGDQVGEFEPGQLMLVGQNVAHDWVSYIEEHEVAENRDGVMLFSMEFVEGLAGAAPELQRAVTMLRDVGTGILISGRSAEDIAAMHERMRTQGPALRLATFIGILDALAEVPEEDHVALDTRRRETMLDGSFKTPIDIALDYIFSHLDGDVRLGEAARRAGMSESALSRSFTKLCGITFSEVLSRARIAHACRLLASTDLSISDVALHAGYRNLSNFNRAFKQHLSQTPREYRKGS